MNYKEIIESKYNRESWQQLLHDIFLNKVTFHNSPGKVHVNGHLAKEALNLGYIKLSDGLTIAIYEVELSDNVDIERNGVVFVICSPRTGAPIMQVLLCSAIARMKAYYVSPM